MEPKLNSWVPLSCSEVYEEIVNSEYAEVDKELETPSVAFFKKSLIWYLETFHIVTNISQERQFFLAETFCSKYDLSSQEVIQILDIVPRKLVDLHCILPNCDRRFSEKGISEILELIIKTFEGKKKQFA